MSATPVKEWTDHALARLGEEGFRSSAPRAAVVEAIGALGCSVTAREISDHLSSTGEGVGLASVYRTLELLEGMRLVQRCEVVEGGARYEAAHPGGEHHHHLLCHDCGNVTPFEDEALEQAIHRLADRVDHRVEAHDVTLRGLCPRCASAR